MAPTAPEACTHAAALLDDDVFVQEAWRFFAESQGLRILVVGDPDELLAATKDWPADVPLFVDLELPHGRRGDQLAAQLIARGHRRVFLATGHDPASVPPVSGLSGIIGKTPPAWLAGTGQDPRQS
jgi:FixJ family two-component response regulator